MRVTKNRSIGECKRLEKLYAAKPTADLLRLLRGQTIAVEETIRDALNDIDKWRDGATAIANELCGRIGEMPRARKMTLAQDAVLSALDEARGNMKDAARILGKPYRTVVAAVNLYGLKGHVADGRRGRSGRTKGVKNGAKKTGKKTAKKTTGTAARKGR